MGRTAKLGIAALAVAVVVAIAIAMRPATLDEPVARPVDRAATAAREHAARTAPRRDVPATPFGIDGTVTTAGAGVRAHVVAQRMGPARDSTEWSGVRVKALAAPPAERGDAEARTDASGVFAFDDLDEGTHRLVATLADGRRAVRLVDLTAQAPRARVVLDVADAGCSLRGRVVTADGSPVQAWVRLHQNVIEDATWTRTDARGAFAFAGLLPVRTYLLVTEQDAAWSATARVQLPFDGEYLVTLDLGTVVRRGRVVAAHDGAPVAGAEITIRSGSLAATQIERRVVSGKDGTFESRCAKRSWFLVSAPGFVRASVQDDGKPEEVIVRLTRTAAVAGRVVRSDDGRPVEGAVVRARPANDSGWSAERTARSGADGSFRVEDVAPGEAEVYVFGGGWVSPDLAKARRGGFDPFLTRFESGATGTVELRAEPAARAAGRVVDAADAPVPGISVGCAPSPWFNGVPHTSASARARGDGTFAFDDLLPGIDYSFGAYKPFGISTQGAPVRMESGKTTEVVIRLEPERRIEVTVLDEGDGTPIAGAIVSLAPAGTRPHGEWGTDAAGRVEIGPLLVSGPIVVRAKAAGHVESPKDVPAEAVDATHLRAVVRLARGTPLAGRVVLPEGFAMGDVRVSVRTDPDLRDGAPSVNASTTPAADGSFRFDTLPEGAYVVSASIPTEQTYHATAKARTGGDAVVLTLAKSASGGDKVDVRVLDADGGPVAEATLALLHVYEVPRMDGTSRYHRRGSGVGAVATVRDGKATLTLPQAERAERWLEVRQPVVRAGSAPCGAAVVRLPDPHSAQIEIRLAGERRITGRVIGPDGRGVARVRVVAQPFACASFDRLVISNQEEHGSATTDVEGAFDIGRLGDFTYGLSITAPPGFAPVAPLSVVAGASGVEVRLARGVEPLVTVVGPDGAALAWCSVTATAIPSRGRIGSDAPSPVSATTTADGVAKLPALDPVTAYWLSVSPPRDRDDLLPFSVETWSPADLRVQLAPAFAISGVVRDTEGRPVPRAIVWFQRDPPGYADSARAGARGDGTFRIARLVAGEKVRLRALPEGSQDRGPQPVVDGTLATAGDYGVVLVLDAGATLRVRVVGMPAGVRVPYTVRSVPRTPPSPGSGNVGFGGGGAFRQVHVPTDGLLVLGDLPANATHRVFVGPTATGLCALSGELATGGDEVVLRLTQGDPLDGRVVLPPGVDGKEVFLHASGDGWTVSATPAADGRFRFPGLPPNVARLDASVYRAGKTLFRGTAMSPTAGVLVEMQPEAPR